MRIRPGSAGVSPASSMKWIGEVKARRGMTQSLRHSNTLSNTPARRRRYQRPKPCFRTPALLGGFFIVRLFELFDVEFDHLKHGMHHAFGPGGVLIAQ
jgi:hypothetical protein